MKKAFLVFGFVAAGSAAMAQNDEFKTFKPKAKSVTTELGLTGGILNSDFDLNEGPSGLLRFRYFVKEQLALRGGINISAINIKENVYGVNVGDEGKIVESNTGVLLNLGIEKHFNGTPRLSPYVGGDLLLGWSSQKVKGENTDGDVFVDNASYTVKGPGTFSIGLRGVVGADYYVAKHVYIGAEAGLGFLYGTEGKTTTTVTVGTSTTTTELGAAGSVFTLQPTVVTGVRIGFVF